MTCHSWHPSQRRNGSEQSSGNWSTQRIKANDTGQGIPQLPGIGVPVQGY